MGIENYGFWNLILSAIGYTFLYDKKIGQMGFNYIVISKSQNLRFTQGQNRPFRIKNLFCFLSKGVCQNGRRQRVNGEGQIGVVDTQADWVRPRRLQLAFLARPSRHEPPRLREVPLSFSGSRVLLFVWYWIFSCFYDLILVMVKWLRPPVG